MFKMWTWNKQIRTNIKYLTTTLWNSLLSTPEPSSFTVLTLMIDKALLYVHAFKTK